MFKKRSLSIIFALLVILALSSGPAAAQGNGPSASPVGTAFTYQGQLKDSGGNPVTAYCDFQFSLYDAASSGNKIGSTLNPTNVQVSNGLFSVALDFGPGIFTGNALWLQIAVRCPAGSGSYNPLNPLQPLTPAPYALYAPTAGSVPWSGLTRIPAGYLLPQGCANNQVPKWNGSAWSCAADNNTTTFWSLTGNAGTNPSTNYLGTSDPVALTFKVGGVTALRLLPDSTSPNIIGGSDQNQVVSGTIGAVIGGGGAPTAINQVQGNYSVVGGGVGNATNGIYATVSGGVQNTASGPYTSIGGGWKNVASGSESTVAGGAYNNATDSVATVGGGAANAASGYISTIGGGNKNVADGDYSTIAGGDENNTVGVYSVAAGGYKNNVTGDYAAIGGGSGNAASGSFAVIGGGGGTLEGAVPNQARGDWGTVGGGRSNTASGPAATVGGGDGNTASAVTDTVPGGSENTASGGYSFAAGAQASATQIGSFVWSSSEATASWGDFTFTARAPGGVRFYTASGTSTGVELSAGGGMWGSLSDKNSKFNFAPVNDQQVLEKLAALPISTWSYLSQDASIHHMGPMAQDFSAAFGLGEDAHYIGTLDADGVALASIQGLYQLSQQQAAEIRTMKAQLSQMEKTGSPHTNSNLPLIWVVVGLLIISQVGMLVVLLRKREGRS